MSLRSEIIRVLNEVLGNSKKISELTAAASLDGSELVELVQDGVNVKSTTQDIADLGGGGGAVTSVNGQTGVVVLDAGDIGNTPSGTVAATDVQGAINELDSEKQSASQVSSAISTATVGVQDLFISAAAMWPRTTNPCADLAKTEMTTSLFNIQSLDFDQTTQEFCQFQIVLPRKWNNGTVTAVFYWTAAAGSGTVQWGISGGAYSNDDALTVALGSAQTADDTLLATNDLHISPATSAMTLAGTPADADFLAFQISRNPASDTLNADAKLLGVSIRVTTDAAIDA